MGMGWKEFSRTEVRRRLCKCGKGEVIEYSVEEESDFSVEVRRRTSSQRRCVSPVEECEFVIE